MTDSIDTNTFVTAVDILAVIGSASADTLGALSGTEKSAEFITYLQRQPGVTHAGAHLTMAKDTCNTHLTILLRDEPGRYRQAHQLVFDHLYATLRDGNAQVEAQLHPVFERLANFLLLDFDRFSALIESIDMALLQHKATSDTVNFFRAVWLRKLERFEDALQLFDDLLADARLSTTLRGRCINSRAATLERLSRLDEAVDGYEESIRWWQTEDNRLRTGIAQMNLGSLYYELQSYAQGEANLRRAIDNFRTVGSLQWLAAAQHELALFYRNRGEWVQALTLFEEVRQRRAAEQAEDAVGQVHSNIGELYMFTGEFERALHHLQLSLEKMSTRVYHSDVWLNIGLIYQSLDRLPEAQNAFMRAWDSATTIGRMDILPLISYRLGHLAMYRGQLNRAEQYNLDAIQQIESTRHPMSSEELRISFMGRWQQVYEVLVLLCLERHALTESFQWAERARARAFAEAIMHDGEPEMTLEPLVALNELQAALSADATLLCYFTTGVLTRDIPLLHHIPQDNPLRRHLLTPPKTILFVITRNTITAHTCPINPNMLTGDNPVGRMLEPRNLHGLRRVLLGPIKEAHGKQLYIVPHGPLHTLPLAALVENSDLIFAPSATLLLHHHLADVVHQGSGGCLAVGYAGNRPNGKLHYTEVEASIIAATTGGDALIGPGAKKASLATRVQQARWIHFACHGAFEAADPLASYLEIGADERLSAREILETWRLSAELVTLSACLSGTSKILRGDEPMGLVRAFLAVGARAVLVTQWEVDDLATFLLMRRFYLLQNDSLPFATALRLAQTWLRHATHAELQTVLKDVGSSEHAMLPDNGAAAPYAHPRYWAAFILIG
ncbi:MAG: CHAT domain-containing tetratricopeptide repeat protein [Anaerolineae bacterium]|nr:CHAT domain-containing tetratricopeptide repeat protein [Anaerolineae bacterium]